MCFGVHVGTWNLDSLSGRGGEFCEELTKRMIDVCCFHEMIWGGQGAGMLAMKGWRYKQVSFWKRRCSWSCVSYGEGGAM